MTTIDDINERVRVVLGDTQETRFSTEMLTEAVRLALDTFNQRLPRVVVEETILTTGGRKLTLTLPEGFLYVMNVEVSHGSGASECFEPGGGFTYQVAAGILTVNFSKKPTPAAGDTLRLTYAAGYNLAGLDGAAVSTLAGAYESALVNGAAGHACLLRATQLAETYGTRPGEPARLLQLSQQHLEAFGSTLASLKTLQEFGFPPGFALDAEDSNHRGRPV